MVYEITCPQNLMQCRELIKGSSLYDGETDGSLLLSHWTLMKGGPLVRGLAKLIPEGQGSRVQLLVTPNYYRIFASLVFVLLISFGLAYSLGSHVLPLLFKIWILPFGGLTILQMAFIPWAAKKLCRALSQLLAQTDV